jgi:S1-C subfamily serine protease
MIRVAAIAVAITILAVAVVAQQNDATPRPANQAAQEPDSEVTAILNEMQVFEAPRLGLLMAPAPHGELLIIGIRPGSPAERAHLRRGDFIVKIDGQDVPSVDTLKAIIERGPRRDSATLTVWRGGNESERAIFLLPEEQEAELPARPWAGMQIDEVTGQGLVIKSVFPGGPADKVGLQAGDLIVSANGTPLKTLVDAEKLLRQIQPFAEVQVVVRRGPEERVVQVKTARLRETPEGVVIENAPGSPDANLTDYMTPQAMAQQQERWEAEQRHRLELLLQEIRHDVQELKTKVESLQKEGQR